MGEGKFTPEEALSLKDRAQQEFGVDLGSMMETLGKCQKLGREGKHEESQKLMDLYIEEQKGADKGVEEEQIAA